MDVTVGMPVKGYLKKYVLWKENYPENGVLDLSKGGEIPMVLSGLLTGKMTFYEHEENQNNKLKDYDEELRVKVTLSHYNNQLLFYTKNGIRFFNKYLWRNFHETLLMRILWNEPSGVSEKDTILTFMEVINVTEDDITFDALKKSSYRLRKSRNLALFRLTSSKNV
jgi:hypothetical protein